MVLGSGVERSARASLLGPRPSPPRLLLPRPVFAALTNARFSLLGMTLLQTLSYMAHHWHSDSPRLKATVISVTIIDTVHQGLISHCGELRLEMLALLLVS